MKREESIKAFFKALKISLKNYSIYDEHHPSFKHSVKSLKFKLDQLFPFLDECLSIGFSTHSIFLGDKPLEREKLYSDIAKMFHLRKFKKIDIKPAVTLRELELFLSKAYLPQKDLLKSGGIKKLLEKENISNIKVQELDYSQLLKGEGEEILDVWTYLLKEAAEEKNEQKMDYLADNYDKIQDKITAKEIIDDDLSKDFKSFFDYLGDKKKGEYVSFSKRIIKSAVTRNQNFSEEKIDKLKPLLADLSEKDLASLLWEEISSNEDFDEVSFDVFSKLLDKEKHKQIAESLKDVVKTSKAERDNQRAHEKIRELLTEKSSHLISEVFRNSLQSLLKDLSERPEKVFFDKTHLRKNYQLMLLNTLEKEKNKETSSEIIKAFLDEWNNIIETEDFEYLKCLYQTIDEKKELLSSLNDFQKLEFILIEHSEELILKGELSLQFNYFIENMSRSTKDENIYLENIFTEEVVTPYVLKAFFRFFADYLFYFNLNLEQKSGNERFLEKVIESLSLIDTSISLITLKTIFKLGSHNIKIKTLEAMENLSEKDDRFLFPLLKNEPYKLKKQAFLLLSRHQNSKQKALDMMFFLKSPFGLKNKKLHQNIQIMDELKVREAKNHLTSLSVKKFIWNKNLRKHASEVLKKLT